MKVEVNGEPLQRRTTKERIARLRKRLDEVDAFSTVKMPSYQLRDIVKGVLDLLEDEL